MESPTLINSLGAALQWLGGGFVALLSIIGAGNIVLKILERVWKNTDDKKLLHETLSGKQIEADSQFLQSLLNRVEKLETEHREMQEKLLNQAVTTARTEEENKHLKETNLRQEQEINGLREDRRKDGLKIINLENDLHRTQDELKQAQGLIKELSEKFDQLRK